MAVLSILLLKNGFNVSSYMILIYKIFRHVLLNLNVQLYFKLFSVGAREPGRRYRDFFFFFLRLYTKYIEMSTTKLIHEQWDPYRKKI